MESESGWLRPGSREAEEAGCICPVLDNAHGRGRMGDGERFGWVMVVGCPVHHPHASYNRGDHR